MNSVQERMTGFRFRSHLRSFGCQRRTAKTGHSSGTAQSLNWPIFDVQRFENEAAMQAAALLDYADRQLLRFIKVKNRHPFIAIQSECLCH
jgi:hypothetical protein